MRIVCNDENKIAKTMMDTFVQAATICVEKEGLNPSDMEVSLTFVDGEQIQQINREYRGVYAVTDVLSFPMIEDFDDIIAGDEVLLGDVVINMDRVEEQAQEFGHSLDREAVYLFVHSICHLLGFDHMEEEDKQEMREREEEVMTILDLERRS